MLPRDGGDVEQPLAHDTLKDRRLFRGRGTEPAVPGRVQYVSTLPTGTSGGVTNCHGGRDLSPDIHSRIRGRTFTEWRKPLPHTRTGSLACDWRRSSSRVRCRDVYIPAGSLKGTRAPCSKRSRHNRTCHERRTRRGHARASGQFGGRLEAIHPRAPPPIIGLVDGEGT